MHFLGKKVKGAAKVVAKKQRLDKIKTANIVLINRGDKMRDVMRWLQDWLPEGDEDVGPAEGWYYRWQYQGSIIGVIGAILAYDRYTEVDGIYRYLAAGMVGILTLSCAFALSNFLGLHLRAREKASLACDQVPHHTEAARRYESFLNDVKSNRVSQLFEAAVIGSYSTVILALFQQRPDTEQAAAEAIYAGVCALSLAGLYVMVEDRLLLKRQFTAAGEAAEAQLAARQ